MRRERLKEMASVKAARERALEEEEMFTNNKQKSDEMKRQRETEIELMRMARQEALEEEERMEKMSRLEHARAVSPGLLAAKNVAFNRAVVQSGSGSDELLLRQLFYAKKTQLKAPKGHFLPLTVSLWHNSFCALNYTI